MRRWLYHHPPRSQRRVEACRQEIASKSYRRTIGQHKCYLAVDLHAIRSNPPGFDLIFCQKVQQSKIRSVAQRAVFIDFEFQYAVSYGFADVEGLLIWRDADSVGVIEIVRYLDPFLAARRKIENFPHYGGW